MPKLVKKDIWYDSSDGINRVAAYIYTDEEVPPRCVLQISHGMCEYISRYDDFAYYLAQNGVVVCGNDHLGHGSTAQDKKDLGYFSEMDGRRYALADLKTLNAMMHRDYPGLPLVLLGHSMGSFFARKYAAEWPQTIDGLILSGTGGPNPQVDMGIGLSRGIAKVFGKRFRSRLLNSMTFKDYLKQIKRPGSPYDWVSRDEAMVEAYENDPLCTFKFTANGFHELYNILKEVNDPQWAAAMPKELPVYLFSGDADPVGDYGRGVLIVRDMLQEAGVEDLQCKLYPGGRHEMLNEINRQEVYDDVLEYLKAHWFRAENPQLDRT